MATVKLTITVPEPIANELMRRVPARRRSQYIVEAVQRRLAGENARLVEACRKANAEAEVREIEEDFGRIETPLAEPWDDTSKG